LFHDAERRAFARVPVGNHRETMPVRGSGFRGWLAHALYRGAGKPPAAQSLADAIGVIEARAVHDGPRKDTAVRVAGLGGRLYLDLANDQWQAVEVGPEGWRVVSDPPVRFRRPRGVLPLPVPTRGRLDDLRRLLNVADDRQWCLIVAWLVTALRNCGPYPILSLHGEQGSAKSTAGRLIRRVVDPNKVCLRSEPKEPRDLAITAGNSWVVALDNLSGLPGWLSDALCRLATGGGFATRQLFSDDEEMLFDAQRPIIVNGIAAVGSRPDLLERSLLIELPAIPDAKRRTEADLYADFDAALPGILGGLLDAVAGALRDLPGVALGHLPRMADFAAWATAAEGALGWPRGTFLAAYTDARQQAVEVALDASPIADPLRRLLDGAGPWQGTASELLHKLASLAVDGATKAEDWPRRANSLSAQLRRLAPDLRRAGISVRWERQARKRTRLIYLEKLTDSSSASSAPVAPGETSSAGSSAEPGDSAGNLWPADGADDADGVSPDFSAAPGRDYPANWDDPLDPPQPAAAEPRSTGERWLKSLDAQNGPYKERR
jgi:hypothetical protein